MDWDGSKITINDYVQAEESLEKNEDLFYRFIKNFREDNVFLYREQLKRNCRLGNFHLTVNLEDLESYHSLATKIKAKPSELLDLV